MDLLQITARVGAHTRAHTHNKGRPRSGTLWGGPVTTVQLYINPQVLFYRGCCSASGESAPKTPLCPRFLVFSKDSMSLCISLRLSPPGAVYTRSLCRDAHGSLLRPWHLLTTRAGTVNHAPFASTSSPPPSSSRERQCPEGLPGAGVLREPTQGPHLPALSRKRPQTRLMRFPVTPASPLGGWHTRVRGTSAHCSWFRALLRTSQSWASSPFNKACLALYASFLFSEISHWWGW